MPNSLMVNLISESVKTNFYITEMHIIKWSSFTYNHNRFDLCIVTWRTLMSEDCQSTSFDTTWFKVEQHFQEMFLLSVGNKSVEKQRYKFYRLKMFLN